MNANLKKDGFFADISWWKLFYGSKIQTVTCQLMSLASQPILPNRIWLTGIFFACFLLPLLHFIGLKCSFYSLNSLATWRSTTTLAASTPCSPSSRRCWRNAGSSSRRGSCPDWQLAFRWGSCSHIFLPVFPLYFKNSSSLVLRLSFFQWVATPAKPYKSH